MAKPRLKLLGPRIPVHSARRVRAADALVSPGVTPRLRGRQAVLRRKAWLGQHTLCAHCESRGRVSAGMQVDHRMPLWDGGADDGSNFQTLCDDCHRMKTAEESATRGYFKGPAMFSGH